MSLEKSEDEENEKAFSGGNYEVLSLVEKTTEGFLANGLWMTKKEEELNKEIEKMSTEKAKNLFSDEKDRRAWVEAIKKSVELSIQSQVRAALGTPPGEKRKKLYEQRLAEERRRRRLMNENFDVDRTTGKPNYSYPSLNEDDDMLFYKRQQYLQKYAVRRTMRNAHAKSLANTNENADSLDGCYGVDPLSREFNKRFGIYTRAALENVGKSCANANTNSVYKRSLGCEWVDRNGESHEIPGPFWPKDHLPRLSSQKHIHFIPDFVEQLNTEAEHFNTANKAIITNPAYPQQWRGTCIVYERQNNGQGTTHVAPPGCPPSLTFESRFECGNLRQARRVGTYEYDLMLDCDLYTKRHMQWYYFRVQNMVTDAVYKFNIINLLKRDSLYNYGMKPLVYSEKEATVRGRGWKRVGCNISYFKTMSYNNPLLCRQYVYYTLSFQMEFSHVDDTCYLAHCYPYSYTDLELYLRSIVDKPRTCQHVQKEVLCKTMAGNNCYVLTITSTKVPENEKLGVVVSARVHPGETNASWMMKGMLDFLTSGHHVAEKLRRKFVFKLVPMLNPDGVIVGNYRTNLAARDLNRTYKNPKKESFPTVWHMKNMLESFKKDHQVIIYCDLHGHSRKPNVFMYGCTADPKMASMSNFIEERLFPWMMSQKAPDKFSFNGCKFRVRKCKESTARVVMWRQMGITNSFTMEATFCGANFGDIEKGRHFHVGDFEEMGRHFCEVLLDYSEAKNGNRSEMTQSFVELACKMTRDILRQSLGSFQPGKSATDTEKETATTKRRSHDSRPKQTEDREEETSDTYERSSSLSKLKNALDSQTERLKAGEDVGVELTVKSVHVDAFNECLKILENINLVDCYDESDSSDSDSDAGVDLEGNNESSSRKSSVEKKKKKKKKKKAKHWWDTLSKPQVQEASSSTATEDDDGNKERKVNLNFGKFVNPYVNRSNGGIPIFSQERIQERAKKKEEQEPKSSQDSQRKECLVKYEEERHNSAPVLAVTDDTELNLVTAQRRLAYYMFTSNQQYNWGANTAQARNKFLPGHSKQVMEVDSVKFDYPGAGGGYGFAIRIPGTSPSVSQGTQAELTHGTEQLRRQGLQSFEEARSRGGKKQLSPFHNYDVIKEELRAEEVLPGVPSTHHRRYIDDDFDETKTITSRHAMRNTVRQSAMGKDLSRALEFEFLAKQRKHFTRSRSEYTMSFLGANEDEFKSLSAKNRTRIERPLLEPPVTIPGYPNVRSPLNGRKQREPSIQ